MVVVKHLAVMIALTAGLVWAQSTTSQTPPPSAQGESAAGSTKSTQTQPGARPGRPMGQSQDMHHQQMQDIQASLAKMHALLNSMRAGYATMNTKDQPAMQANIEMWQLMLDHMDRMMQHMQSMEGGMGAGGGMPHHHGGMGMRPEGPASPPQPGTPQQPPPK
jgi:hypothetical protein